MSSFWVSTPRDAVRVSGADARSYLQSQLSQDLGGLEIGSSVWSFLLQPTGKLAALVRVTNVAGDELVLDVDGGFGGEVVARLERFRIRVKADIVALGWQAVAVRNGPVATTTPPPGGVAAPAWWGAECGVDLLGPEVTPPADVAAGDAGQLDEARVRAGWPAMGAEITEQTIPGELGPVVELAVSFTKGCYPGQELVERMHSRGATAPRVLRRLQSVDGDPLVAGAAVTLDERDVGTVTSVAGPAALALVGRAVEPEATVTVGGTQATVRAVR
jgi:folate-binding protein YgfZ